MATVINSDGLLVRFGRDQGLRGAKTAVTTDTTKVNEMALLVDLEGGARTIFSTDRNNDGTNDGFGGLDTPIPAGAVILDQNVIVIEAIAGTTPAYTVGTFTEAGAEIDADGIRTAAGANGAQIGTQTTQRNFVTVATTGTFTSGIVKIVIRYLIR